MSTKADVFSMAKKAQINPMVANSEAAAKTTADGATAGANDGPDEVAGRHPRQQPPSMQNDRMASQCAVRAREGAGLASSYLRMVWTMR